MKYIILIISLLAYVQTHLTQSRQLEAQTPTTKYICGWVTAVLAVLAANTALFVTLYYCSRKHSKKQPRHG